MTEVKQIRTEKDYETDAGRDRAAVGRSKTAPLEGDRLDVLVTLVEAYKAEHHPMDPPDPIEASNSAWSSRA